MEMNLEQEKLKLQAIDSVLVVAYRVVLPSTYSENKTDPQKLLLTVRAETDDITLLLVLIMRQLKMSKIPQQIWSLTCFV
ncbi:hypothetical protein CEXT_579931 [Caerostris extrusa]|uniref:Uncharacterized protein n=1 Tax=Caerostris extrusa TaxID=172846 RepID=A0AAV4NM33_CAEEX|nr:hypothetical protein CEXT_579931 [Caerostris extrusa]